MTAASSLLASLRPFALVGAVTLLAGCSDLGRALGIERAAPDEFQVLSRAPLVQPPEYALRPPTPGAPRPQEVATSETAARTVFGRGVTTGGRTPGEQALLEAAGVPAADPAVRTALDWETEGGAVTDPALVERLQEAEVEVDPAAEAARLQRARDEGAPVTDGPTPVVRRRGSDWF